MAGGVTSAAACADVATLGSVHPIVSTLAEQVVTPWTADQVVEAAAAFDEVLALRAEYPVAAGVSVGDVVAAASADGVVAVVPRDRLLCEGSLEGVIARPPERPIFAPTPTELLTTTSSFPPPARTPIPGSWVIGQSAVWPPDPLRMTHGAAATITAFPAFTSLQGEPPGH